MVLAQLVITVLMVQATQESAQLALTKQPLDQVCATPALKVNTALWQVLTPQPVLARPASTAYPVHHSTNLTITLWATFVLRVCIA